MTTYLLMLAIGPVQEFIAQARRTRDLWFGSHVLSEVCKASARALLRNDTTTLIFPALKADDARLRECDQPWAHESNEPAYNVANKLLAVVSGDPQALAQRARECATRRLRHWAERTFSQCESIFDERAQKAAHEQLNTLLEFHALWAPCDVANSGEYRRVRSSLENELMARKQTHVFSPWREHRGVRKSSLDGARETVLQRGNRQQAIWRRLRITPGEELDAIGLLKRAGGTPEQFVPIPTIGLAAWIECAREVAPEELSALSRRCRDELKLGSVWRRQAWVQAFPHDAQVLLPERWVPHFAEYGLAPDEAETFGREHIAPLLERVSRQVGEPYPYVACVVADGDHMGTVIDELAMLGITAHQEVSRVLAQFTITARTIVERDHRGVLIYAGGDDVLAFVCVQDAIRCATALQCAFVEGVSKVLTCFDAVTTKPTLSVGVGVGHVLQSLGNLLELGREAERSAKRAGRDRLAVRFEKHSGTQRQWISAWDDQPQTVLERSVGLLDSGSLSTKKVHELALLRERCPSDEDIPDSQEQQAWTRYLHSETRRILARSGLGMNANRSSIPVTTPSIVGLDQSGIDLITARSRLKYWIEHMAIAREFARCQRVERGTQS